MPRGLPSFALRLTSGWILLCRSRSWLYPTTSTRHPICQPTQGGSETRPYKCYRIMLAPRSSSLAPKLRLGAHGDAKLLLSFRVPASRTATSSQADLSYGFSLHALDKVRLVAEFVRIRIVASSLRSLTTSATYGGVRLQIAVQADEFGDVPSKGATSKRALRVSEAASDPSDSDRLRLRSFVTGPFPME